MAEDNRENQKFNHNILIVDDDKDVGRAIARIIKKLKLNFVYASNGEEALEKIKKTNIPFSIIISDQRMPGMKGSEFLKHSRKISPDSVRFLITGYSDMDAILDAVNKGAINRYISKPWDTKEFIKAIKSGIKQYELILENERLLRLANDQNSKLYKLNCELKDKTENHKKTIAALNREIDDLTAEIEMEKEKTKQDNSTEKIKNILKEKNMLDQEKMNQLYRETIKDLFEQFKDIAARNGFEMPETI